MRTMEPQIEGGPISCRGATIPGMAFIIWLETVIAYVFSLKAIVLDIFNNFQKQYGYEGMANKKQQSI